MATCKVCQTVNPDDAVVCHTCRARLNGPDAAQTPRRETIIESQAPPPQRKPTVEESDYFGAAGRQNPHSAQGTAPARNVTGYIDRKLVEGVAEKAAPESGKVRRMVGLLVTYTWTDQGQVFPIFEGRNRIGRDPSQCEIAIPQDDSMSAVNSHVIYRKNFIIGDDVSMNGTYVDGEPVETQFHPLRNYSQVRTGATVWTFIAIQPPSAGAPDMPSMPEP